MRPFSSVVIITMFAATLSTHAVEALKQVPPAAATAEQHLTAAGTEADYYGSYYLWSEDGIYAGR